MDPLQGDEFYEQPPRPVGLRRDLRRPRRHLAESDLGVLRIHGTRSQLAVVVSCSLAFAISVLVLAIIFWPKR